MVRSVVWHHVCEVSQSRQPVRPVAYVPDLVRLCRGGVCSVGGPVHWGRSADATATLYDSTEKESDRVLDRCQAGCQVSARQVQDGVSVR